MNRRFLSVVFIIMNIFIYPQMAFSQDHNYLARLLQINTKWEEKSRQVYKYNYIIKTSRL